MGNPEVTTEWDRYYTDISNASTNIQHRPYDPFSSKFNQSNRAQHRNSGDDKDEFYIYSTCVSVRGEQSDFSPRRSYHHTPYSHRITSFQNTSDNPNTQLGSKEDYECRIKELTEKLNELESKVDFTNRFQRQSRGFDQENSDNNGFDHFDETDDEVEEIMEEICTVKKRPKGVETAENGSKHTSFDNSNLAIENTKHHLVDLTSETIDESQFPSNYWSRLQSHFYNQFQKHKSDTRNIGIQLAQVGQRTTATMVTPVNFKKIRCVGVSVFPLCKEIGVVTDGANTRDVGCLFTETDEMFADWLSTNYPELKDTERNLIRNIAYNRIKKPEKFVKLLLSLLNKSSQDIMMASTKPEYYSRSCSTTGLNSLEQQNIVLPGSQKPHCSTQSIQAQPILRNKSTSLRNKFGVSVACNTEFPVLRSQGTSTTRISSACNKHGNLTLENLKANASNRRRSAPATPASSVVGENNTQPLKRIVSDKHGNQGRESNIHDKHAGIRKNLPSFSGDPKILKITSKEEKVSEYQEKIDFSSSQIHTHDAAPLNKSHISRPVKLVGSSNSSPRHVSPITKPNESYSVLTERRILDELHERHLSPTKMDLDRLVQADDVQFNETVAQFTPLSTSHSVKEFEPTVEVFHHTGDITEEIDPSALPMEIVSNMGDSTSPELGIKYRSRSNSISSTHPYASSVGVGRDNCRTPIFDQYQDTHSKINSQTIPQPHIMSTNTRIPVRNYMYELNPDIRRACESLVGFYQAEQTIGRKEVINGKFSTIVKTWFDLTTATQMDLLKIEDFIAILHGYSTLLLCDIIQSTDENENTSLHYAIGHGAWQVVNLVLDTGYANPDQYNQSGFTALMIAALSNISDNYSLPTLRRLFSLGDTDLRTNTIARQTALMLAALHGSVDVCSLLVECGADVNAQDASGNTALMCAIEQQHIDIIVYLITHPDTNLKLKDNNGKDALAIARSKGDDKIVQLILSAIQSPPQVKQPEPRIYGKIGVFKLLKSLHQMYHV